MVSALYEKNTQQSIRQGRLTIMKKLVKISAVILTVGIIFTAIGAVKIRKDNVNAGNIYNIIENNLHLSESNIKYKMPLRKDISSVNGKKSQKNISYGLNEFNTIEFYTENTSITFENVDDEQISFEMKLGELDSAVTNGVLYVQASSVKSGMLTVSMPEIYKGGLVINGTKSQINIGDFESSMDIKLNLYECVFNADIITADNISVMSSSSTIKTTAGFEATENIDLSAVASNYETSVYAKSISALADNCTLIFNDVKGSFNADLQMSKSDISFSHIIGNISLATTACTTQIKIPKSEKVFLKNEEYYAVLTNHAVSVEDKQNPDTKYSIEANTKFGTLDIINIL